MPVVIRKNGALNNAAAGLERGITAGLGLGQDARKIADQEQQQQFENTQVLRKAKLADEENQRAAGLRGATADYAQALTEPDAQAQGPAPVAKNAPGMYPGAPANGGAAPQTYDQQLQRIGGILGTMAKNGASAQEITTASELFKAKQKEKANDDTKEQIGAEVTRGVAAGSYFTQQPDGTRTSTPAVDKALEKLTEATGNKNSSASEVRMLKANLDREQILAKSTFEHVTNTVAEMRAAVAQARQPETPGPQTATQAMARQARTQKMQMLLSTYEHVAPQKMGGDPKEWANWQAEFHKEWAQAENNIAYTGKYGDVSFENADQMRKAELENAQLKQALVHTQMQHLQAQISEIPQRLGISQQNANAAAKNADAHMIEAGRPRGPASGTVSPSPSPEAQYKMAGDTVAARDPKAWADMTVEQQNAERLKEMGRMRQAKQGFQSIDQAQAAGNTNAPTTQLDPNVLAQKAKAAHWTLEETKKFRDTGVAPAGKPPIQ